MEAAAVAAAADIAAADIAAADEAAAAAERVAVSESLESATAGAPAPVAEPEGATALGLDNLRIAVQASLDEVGASAPPSAPPSGWEDVGDDKVLAALRSLEAMGFVESLGADACLARVQMHMTSSGDVNLDAAVADLVALMKGPA